MVRGRGLKEERQKQVLLAEFIAHLGILLKNERASNIGAKETSTVEKRCRG